MLKLAARLLILYFGLLVGTAFAVEVTWFGPEQFIRTKGKPDIYTDNFQARAGVAKILVANGDANGSNRLSSAVITLNGTKLFGPRNFNQQVSDLSADIYLEAENTIKIELNGNSNAHLKAHHKKADHKKSKHFFSLINQFWTKWGLGVQHKPKTPDEPYLTVTITQDVPPPTASLSVDPQTIISGQSTTLNWNCIEADTCTIEPGIGQVDLNGFIEVSPAETVTYTLTATSIAGASVSNAEVTVNHPSTVQLSADPQTITLGQSSTLTWSTTNTDSVTIEPGIGVVESNGSIQVTPDQSTTYTITAIGAEGMTAVDTITVAVQIPSPTVNFTAGSDTIVSGQSLTLTWNTTHADSCFISPNVGSVPVNGSVSVSPTQDTTFIITADGAGGTASASVHINVTEPAGSPTVQLEPAETTIQLGQSVTLNWTSTGADTAHIDNGVGSVPVSGTITIDPPEHTTFYTLTVIGPNGSASATMTAHVVGNPTAQPEGTFGYMYNDLIPQDATVAEYDERRFAIVTGIVHDINNAPIEGVTAAISGHLEYGTATTNSDGRFSIPVEGGALMTVVYQKQGLITSHRQVNTPWNDFAIAETVTMLSEDSTATTVIFDGDPNTIYTHQSTLITDDAGSRATTLVFTGDNQAFLVDEKGYDVNNLSTITVRATEYTTPDSMPADLPATSAFTYCAELAVDGAARVRFEKPIIMWVDNFIGFGVGEIVPVGSYNRDRSVWIAEENGVVVRLLDTDSDGIVDALDADGDDLRDDLDGDGDYADEVEGLGAPNKYIAGNTYWRAQVSHFSPWDYNWPYGPPEDAIKPNPDGEPIVDEQCDEKDCPGFVNSYVQQKSRVYHEDIAIPGTDMTLHYSSNRIKKYLRKISVPVSGETVPASLKQIVVKMQLAGKIFYQTIDPQPNQVAHFFWDGFDCYGKPVGMTTAYISIGFVYRFVYYSSASAVDLFWAFARIGSYYTTTRGRPGPVYITLSAGKKTKLYGYKTSQSPTSQDAKPSIAQGWELSNHHWLDQVNDPYTLHKGNGGTVNHLASDYKLSYLDIASVVIPFAGNTTYGYSGDGGPAADAQLMHPRGLAVDAEGNIYIADTGCNCIRKVDTEGIITTVAGNGTAGYGGDGGLAVNAMLRYPVNVAVDAAGNLYIADYDNFRVRKVDTNGIITTVAGNGKWAHNGDEGLATEASLLPADVAFDSSGNLYIADFDKEMKTGKIRRVDSEGYISTLPINEKFAGSVPYIIRNIAFDAEDNLYFSDDRDNLVLKMDRSGTTLELIAGGGSSSGGDGGPATDVLLDNPSEIIVDAAGNIYILESYEHIRKVSTSGIITTVVGNGAAGFSEQGVPLDDPTLLSGLSGVAVNPAGELYVSYVSNAVVGKIGPLVPYMYLDGIDGKVYVEDNGLGHLIDEQTGLHLQTIGLNTGVVLRRFGYDGNRNLVAITDQFGNQTVIQRDAEGTPTAIVSPEGLTTTLTVDDNQNLTRIAYQNGSHYDFEYTPDGLMTAEIEPNGNRFEHVFDNSGRITQVLDEEGGNWTYSRSFLYDGELQVDVTTGEGNLTSYQDYTDSAGVFTSTITDPTGADTFYTRSADGMTVLKTLPCGTQLGFEYGIDTEYKHKYLTKETQTTPAGLKKFTEISRTYQDTDADGVSDRITNTVFLNDKSTTLVHSVLSSQKVVTSPEGRTITSNYDPSDLLTRSVSIPGLNRADYDYDTKGRLTSETTGTRKISYTYDADGFLNSMTDPELKTTYYTHDAVGRITAITRPDGGALGFTYDANGNMTVLTNSVDVDHGFSYNGVNLRSGYDTPVSGSYSYLYDKDRRLIQTNFPSGKQIKNIYTNTQLTQIQTPEDYIDLTYSCGDTVASMTKGGESIGYAYDGKLLTDVTLGGTLNQSLHYVYNDDFNVTAMTYAGSTETFNYDLDGLLTEAGGFSISRNAGNGLPESVTGNGLNINRGFNGYGEVTAQSVSAYSQSLMQWNVVRDNAGRIITKTETLDGETHNYGYSYDAVGRLLSVTLDGDPVESYSYDLSGTRISESNTSRGISNRTFSYSDEDHLLTAGDAAYAYDPDGFLISKTIAGETTTFDYSTRGELLEVQLPDNRIISYDHDPLGRRIAKRIDGVITEKYLWEGLTKLLAVYDGSDILIQRFKYADNRMPVSMTAEGVSYYPAYDQVGSLRIVADGSGNVVKRVDYDTFGNIISDSNPAMVIPFGFAGGLHDRDIGLVRFGYRDYDPDTGRWTAKDPIKFAGGDTDLYGYVQNDPVNLIDPYGLISGVAGDLMGNAISFIGAGVVGIGLAMNPVSWGVVIAGGAIIIGGQIYSDLSTKSDIDEINGITDPITNKLNELDEYIKKTQEETGQCIN